MERDLALLHEALAASDQIIARLSAAGFHDIPGNGPVVMAAIALNRTTSGDLLRKTGISAETASQVAGTLLQRGYLQRAGDPDGQREPPSPSRRGLAALCAVMDGIMAERWAALPFRPGDIVVSTLPKSGTTWMQMICALLIFQVPGLPAPLPELSVWLDTENDTRDNLYTSLAAQRHRRFIKSHLALTEIPNDPRVTYIAVARNPLDSVLSLYHQEQRMNSGRTGEGGAPPGGQAPVWSPRDWLLRWIYVDPVPPVGPGSLSRTMQHLSAAWTRRGEANVELVHYEDLGADLEGQMRRIASRLDITVPETTWPGLVQAATFQQMRAAAGQIQPLAKSDDPAAFFRSGTSGVAAELLTSTELAYYYERAARYCPPELLAWLHRADSMAFRANGAAAESL
jgi:aryl sulfotransferase